MYISKHAEKVRNLHPLVANDARINNPASDLKSDEQILHNLKYKMENLEGTRLALGSLFQSE